MLMVCAAAVQGSSHVKGDLSIRLGILLWSEARCRLKGFMVWVPARSLRDIITSCDDTDNNAFQLTDSEVGMCAAKSACPEGNRKSL